MTNLQQFYANTALGILAALVATQVESWWAELTWSCAALIWLVAAFFAWLAREKR